MLPEKWSDELLNSSVWRCGRNTLYIISKVRYHDLYDFIGIECHKLDSLQLFADRPNTQAITDYIANNPHMIYIGQFCDIFDPESILTEYI
jgi:hypothetical protein